MLYIGTAFYDYFIVYVADDEHLREIPDGIAEKVTGDGLDDIFNELGSITFNAAPVLLAVRSHAADGFSAEHICAHLLCLQGLP